MQERILEILNHLLQRMQEEEQSGRIESATRWLRDSGYTPSEISEAMAVFCKKFQNFERVSGQWHPAVRRPFRVMSSLEKEVISPDAFGYLLQLYHPGLITAEELEQVIERTIMFGGRMVDLEEMKAIAASVLFFDEEHPHQFIQFNEDDRIVH